MNKNTLKRCTKCVMPETWSGISFDEDGVCSLCSEFMKKKNKINWKERQKILDKILHKFRRYAKKRNNKYNCIVGYSGGKDTVYTLWAMVRKYKMKPLVVTFDHSFTLSPEAEWNLMEIPKILDCDHLRFSIGNGLRNALCKKTTGIMGDFCWHCHNGVGTFPARISKQWDIPLQIWGEPTAEYQTEGAYKLEDIEEQDEEHYQKVFQAGIKPEMALPKEYAISDLLPMVWPEGNFKLKAIYLGNYEPWDQRKHVEIITKELGWKHNKVEGTYVDWDKVDCPYESVRDWQKFIKRNLGRTTFQASKDVRDGLITRKEALRLVKTLDGKRPKAMDKFINDVGILEEDFNKLTKRHAVIPTNRKE
ncbi:MAG: N-acetyl sugar amidotransferase [Candidatus Omnitrophica bacterium]|nr:N-acetyl sugar amidotransferase [Candidatus Omnitrophota bacterium]MDD5352398.1 N-acetyl sugar amidotransferase [Candidatus Omnitrophota bacterium]MDD5549996.1 N-acetyl sugar amidotransferase [Candidatus Omnitrophota bacterium]